MALQWATPVLGVILIRTCRPGQAWLEGCALGQPCPRWFYFIIKGRMLTEQNRSGRRKLLLAPPPKHTLGPPEISK